MEHGGRNGGRGSIRQSAVRMAEHAGAIAVAGLVSFLLFVSIPGLQALIAPNLRPRPRAGERKTLIEAVRRAEKKAPQPQRARVRQTGEAKAADFAGAGMMLKFAPDLSVEGAGGVGVAVESQDLAAEVFDENETDEKPMPLYRPPVPYPQRANELGIQGVVQAEIVIDQTGAVESVNIIASPHPSFSAEVRRVIAAWRFTPARNKGIAVRVRVRQAIEFKLD